LTDERPAKLVVTQSRSTGTTRPTANGRGRTSGSPNEISQLFIEECKVATLPVLDIGAAFGVASIPAIEAGATVIANDIEVTHLSELALSLRHELRAKAVLLVGSFPYEFDLCDESLFAIHASNLFNFLSGSEIDEGLGRIRRWLIPGGRAFIASGTPYAQNVKDFIPIYEERKRSGDVWPGEVDNIHEFGDDPTLAELPDFLHLLDDEVLAQAFSRAGFEVERAEMFARAGIPEYLSFDGRENVGIVARAK
jgi:SAM-dependent methyltransferase